MTHPDPLVVALLRPAAWPIPCAEVTLLETHISRLFFAGPRVYKVKKALRLDFLDYGTLAARQRCCEEEVRLNRRLAGAVYRGVVAIRRDADGTIRTGGDGEPIEYAVEMDRLPADRMLDRLLDAGSVDNELVDRLVETLATFHAAAATGAGVDEHASPAALQRLVLGNLDELAATLAALPAGSRPVHELRLDHLRHAAERFLVERAALLEERIHAGRIREGHGDLHAGNVCDLGDRLVIYDCIEFNVAFRCIDVAAEVAFLCMDLDRRGCRGFAGVLARRYAARTGDDSLVTLLPFYKAHYASVRAKVALLRAHTGDDGGALAEAAEYLDLATVRTVPPPLILTCGVPASGKSTAARQVAHALEATVLRSDVVRKELAGFAVTERSREGDRRGIYTDAMSDQVYARLLADAGTMLDEGRPVIVDAAFPTRRRRAPFLAAARERGTPLVCLLCEAADDVIRGRLTRRASDPHEASDADVQVWQHARARFEPPDELPAGAVVRVGPGDVPARIRSRLLDAVVIESNSTERSAS